VNACHDYIGYEAVRMQAKVGRPTLIILKEKTAVIDCKAFANDTEILLLVCVNTENTFSLLLCEL
jgi:hypothetical protein